MSKFCIAVTSVPGGERYALGEFPTARKAWEMLVSALEKYQDETITPETIDADELPDFDVYGTAIEAALDSNWNAVGEVTVNSSQVATIAVAPLAMSS